MGPEVLVPLGFFALVFGIPIVAILTKHQQKMALIFRENAQYGAHGQDAQLANEVRELRELVVQQSLALDNLSDAQRQLAQSLSQKSDIQDRINV